MTALLPPIRLRPEQCSLGEVVLASDLRHWAGQGNFLYFTPPPPEEGVCERSGPLWVFHYRDTPMEGSVLADPYWIRTA